MVDGALRAADGPKAELVVGRLADVPDDAEGADLCRGGRRETGDQGDHGEKRAHVELLDEGRTA